MTTPTSLPLALLHLTQSALAADTATSAPTKSLLDYIHDGGFLSYVLVILSIVALSFAIRNILALRLPRLAPPEAVTALDTALRASDTEAARAYCADKDNNSLLTRILGAALDRCARSPLGLLEFRSALEESGQKEVEDLHRLNDGVGIIAAIGPMLGLLGTVIGMIGAFRAISALQGAARSNELAKFMSIALVNTAEGLIVAIPCTVAFALFRRRIDRLAGQVAQIAEDLAGRLESGAGASPQPQQRPAAPRPLESAPRGIPAA